MTWQTAVAEAQRRIAALPLPPEPAALNGLQIDLVDFDTDAVCYLITGVQPVVFHKTVIRAMKRLLEQRGAKVQFRMLTLAQTVRWQS